MAADAVMGGAQAPEGAEDRAGVLGILAPTGRDGRVICDTLERHGVACASISAEEVVEGIRSGALTGAILAEEALPAIMLKLEKAIEAQPPWSDFPLVVLTSRGEPGDRLQKLARLGNVTLLERPLQATALVAGARALVRARARQRETERFLAAQDAAHANLQALNNLRDLFENAPGMIFMTEGPEHRFRMANATFRELAARPVVGLPLEEAMPELVGQSFWEALGRVYETRKPFVGREITIEIRPPERAPETRSLTFVFQPVIDGGGRMQGVFAEGIDVTNQKLSREKVESLQNDLIHLSRVSAMGVMASTLAHELNQPLTAITNYLRGSRLLLEGGGEAEFKEALGAIEAAERNALRAGGIIRKTREMVVSGRVREQAIDLAQLVRDSLDLALVGDARDGLVAETLLEPGLQVAADRIQVQQVLLNLIRNAVEAMRGCERRELRVSTHSEGSMAVVSVADRGRGLDSAVRDLLFTAFVSSKEGGMGVGLSISRTIIEAHGGTIKAEDNPGGGTIFRFTLRRVGSGGAEHPAQRG